MLKRAFLFDMDGVIVDNMAVHAEAWRLFFRERGLRINLAEFHARTAGMPSHEVLVYYFKRPVSRKEAAALTAAKEQTYQKLYRAQMAPLKGLLKFLKSAKALGLKLGVGTGGAETNVDFILDGLQLREHFDAIVSAKSVRRGKPHPETFLLLARRLGVAPTRCVVFEDSLLGEEAARRAGMEVVAVTTSHAAAHFKKSFLAVKNFSGLNPLALIKMGA